jgi:hypothetical protein
MFHQDTIRIGVKKKSKFRQKPFPTYQKIQSNFLVFDREQQLLLVKKIQSWPSTGFLSVRGGGE